MNKLKTFLVIPTKMEEVIKEFSENNNIQSITITDLKRDKTYKYIVIIYNQKNTLVQNRTIEQENGSK